MILRHSLISHSTHVDVVLSQDFVEQFFFMKGEFICCLESLRTPTAFTLKAPRFLRINLFF